MPAYKDTQKGTWYAAFYYQDWKGIKKKKLKRGFPTKKEALAWEHTFLLQQAADLTMTFEAFVEIYIADKQNRLRENTWSTKEHTRVSLKQALAAQGFAGGTRRATEWTQWVESEKKQLAIVMERYEIQWEQLGTHEEHLSVLDYKKQERAKEVQALDTTIAEKQTQVDKIEQTLQSMQQKVVDLDKIENVSVKKALLSDKVTLPYSDFENLLNAAKQYVVYRRQDDRLQGLLDAANAKIKQLESIIGELRQRVTELVNDLGNVEFWHKQELDEVKSESREVRRENLMLKREQKGLTNLLRRHGIDPAKERTREQERDER